MAEPKPLKYGDPCPVNGMPFYPALVPTDDQYAHLTDPENPAVLSRWHDTASKAVRAALGALYFEPFSNYKTRFPLADIEAAKAPAPAGAAAADVA
jgi:hypothetical protein